MQKTPRLDGRQVGLNILAAAVDVFAARGWDGFTLDSIARAAGVGKSSIYRRYPTREVLILEIMEHHLFDGEGIDSGDYATDLRLLAASYARWIDGPGGRLSLRFFVEDRLNDDFRALWAQQAGPPRAGQRLIEIIDRGKQRGDVDPSVPSTVVLHALLGGVVQQLAASGSPTGAVFTSDEGRRYLDALADSVLRANRPAVVASASGR